MKRGWHELLAVSGLFSILTAVLTWPLVHHFTSRFFGDRGDALQNVWNLWWLRKALFEEHVHPYYTTWLHHPEGVTLLFQTFNPFNAFLALPFQLVFDLHVAYNAVVFLSFASSGLTMYLLARHLTGRRLPSLVAGVAFAFCPYHFAHGLGHLQLIAMEWIPLYVLLLLRTHEEPGTRNAFLAGVVLALNAFCSWYYLIFCVVFTGLFGLARLAVEGRGLLRGGFLRRLGVVALTSYAITAPLLMPMLYLKLSEEIPSTHDPEVWSTDLQAFFVPSEVSAWSGPRTLAFSKRWTGNASENTAYLGYAVLALSLFAALRVRRARAWGLAGLVFAVLALGPHLHVGGETLERVPLPYWLVHEYVPLASFTGVPARFVVMTMLCLAVMVAFGTAELAARFDGRPWAHAVSLLAGAAVALEFYAVPATMDEIRVPEFYRKMADDPDPYAVIDVKSHSETLYYATIHGKPLVGGFVSREPARARRFLRSTPFIGTLYTRRPAPPAPRARREARQVCARYGIRYVISHDGLHREFLEETVGLEPLWQDERVRAYACPGGGAD